MRAFLGAALVAAIAVLPFEARGEDEGPPGVPYVAIRGGIFNPTGPSLDGFENGGALAGAVGWLAEGHRYAWELSWRRSTMSGFGVDIAQSSLLGSLRVHGDLGKLQSAFSVGLGWSTTTLSWNATAQVPAYSEKDSRAGFFFSAGLSYPMGSLADLLLETTYGGAYATLLESPTWIAGFTLEIGIRVRLGGSAPARPATPAEGGAPPPA